MQGVTAESRQVTSMFLGMQLGYGSKETLRGKCSSSQEEQGKRWPNPVLRGDFLAGRIACEKAQGQDRAEAFGERRTSQERLEGARGPDQPASSPCGGGWAFCGWSRNPGQRSELGVMRSEWEEVRGVQEWKHRSL